MQIGAANARAQHTHQGLARLRRGRFRRVEKFKLSGLVEPKRFHRLESSTIAKMRVDAHHHFWKYDPVEYGWISEPMKAIRRDFLAKDLAAAMKSAGVEGAVSVQARQTVEETQFLLDIAAKAKIIWGVVGWVPLVDPKVEVHLEKFAANKRLKGVRHVLQDEPANALMDDKAFHAGIAKLERFNLVYDVLIYERHLEQAIRFIDQHP
ncbi:MAG: hypothetical protein FJW31_29120, partial [Acidobacteria bacterium]|nr:hypothetical protein [Acidobacteriota bacterium]